MLNLRPLGTLNISVSEISFGGAAISGEGGGYGFGRIGEGEAAKLLAECLDRGINLYDTAPVYGYGLSEKRIGRAFAKKRDQVIIVSKGGVVWDDRKRIKIDNRPAVMQKMLEQSLRDLQTDYIDIYMIHWPDKNIDIRKPMEYLSRAKEEGKIRAIGLCNAGCEEISKAAEIDRVDVLQNECNLFNSAPFQNLREMLRAEKMAFLSWGTLDKGILTGRVTPERSFDDVDARSWAPWWVKEDRTPKYQAREKIVPLLSDAGYSLLELALGYVLQYKEISAALCGMRNTGQLTAALDALGHLPPREILDAAKAIADDTLTSYRKDREATMNH